MITVGGDGLRGASIIILAAIAKGFKAQLAVVPEQKAFRSPPIRVTLPPIERSTLLALVTT